MEREGEQVNAPPLFPLISIRTNTFGTTGFKYQYKIGRDPGRAQLWIGTANFCVADVSAGPVSFGSIPDKAFDPSNFKGTAFTNSDLPNLDRFSFSFHLFL